MMRMLWGLLALLAASAVGAEEVGYQRGEYRFAVGPEPAFVVRQEVPSTWSAGAPGAAGAPWRAWLIDEQVDRRAGRDHVYMDYAYEVKDAALLGEAGRYQITFNPGYQRLVIHRVDLRRNGRWQDRLVPETISLARREEDFERDLADGNVTALVVLEDVRVDDLVRVSYSIVGSNPILAGQVLDWSRFGWGSPILKTRLRVLHEPGSQPRVYRENGAPTPAIRRTREATEILFEADRVPAHVDEGAYPNWYQPYPMAQVSKARAWSDVVAWALPLYPPVETLPADLEKRLAQWSALKQPQARVRAALRAVQEEVRYFGVEMGENTHRPNAPGDTWSRRYGDCKDKAYLLTTLLVRMGIPATPALVSTRRGRAIADSPPAAAVFDHVIVRAELEGESLWLDPTLTSEGGDPRDSDLSSYGVALPIAVGVTAPVPIAAPAQPNASVLVTERYEPAADGGQAKLTVETVYRGRSANHARRSFAGARTEEISRRYAEYYRKRLGELAVTALPVLHDDRDANVLTVSEQYLLRAPFEGEGNHRALDVYGEALANPTKLPETIERTGPLNFGMPTRYRHEIEVRLPQRWSASVRDESLSVVSDAFRYERGLEVKDREVRLVYDLDMRAREVPADKVAAHVGELRKVQDSLSARLPLEMPATGREREEREARLRALLRNVLEEETR